MAAGSFSQISISNNSFIRNRILLKLFNSIQFGMEIIVHRGGENYGPYTIDQLMEHLSEGTLDEEDLAWHQGCDDWKTVKVILSLVDIPPTPTAKATVPRIVAVLLC